MKKYITLFSALFLCLTCFSYVQGAQAEACEGEYRWCMPVKYHKKHWHCTNNHGKPDSPDTWYTNSECSRASQPKDSYKYKEVHPSFPYPSYE